MATAKATIHPFPAQERTTLTITSEEISRYAELTALIAQAEEQQKILRSELLAMHAAGAEQENASPYLLSFVGQERRSVDWKAQALKLAEKLYGVEKLDSWKAKVEQSAHVQAITQVRVKPNPTYSSGRN